MTTSPTSSEETVRRATVWIVSTRGMADAGAADEAGYTTGAHEALMVKAADYDTLKRCYDGLLETGNEILAERDRLRQRVAELEAVVRQYASECAECDGTGHGPTIHSVQGGEIVETTLACKECAFIRLALSVEK